MPELLPPRKEKVTNIRGQFSIAAVKNVGANSISGEIETVGRKRAPTRSQPPPVDGITLVSSTKKTITLLIKGQQVTLDRHAAIELASTIFTTFGTTVG